MSHTHRITAAVTAAVTALLVAALVALPSLTTVLAGIILNALD